MTKMQPKHSKNNTACHVEEHLMSEFISALCKLSKILRLQQGTINSELIFLLVFFQFLKANAHVGFLKIFSTHSSGPVLIA